MKILSIETSCDDTCITIFEVKGNNFKILANNTNSQISVHIPYGGVFPSLAKREHIKNLPILLDASLKQAKLNKKEVPVDLIVVTHGPGLEPSLWTGIVFAKELSLKWKVPVMPANHMEGHIMSVFGKTKGNFKVEKPKGPILSLLVSGGHTQLVLSEKWMEYKIIGETLDDAVGEAFDKVARMLELPYPGGPQISKLAENQRELGGAEYNFTLPRPMKYTKDFNFSFSGLKTAVLYLTQKTGLSDTVKSEVALEFENAAIECLTHKTGKAIEKYGVKTLIVSGGVSANLHLRREMKKLCGKNIKLLFPQKELSMDNSIMIGIAGYLRYVKDKKKTPRTSGIKAKGNLRLA